LVKVALRKKTDGDSTFSKFSRSSGKGNLMGTYYLAQNYIKGAGVTANCVTGTGVSCVKLILAIEASCSNCGLAYASH
jgi:hypothetical protein